MEMNCLPHADAFEVEGVVAEVLPGTTFWVKLPSVEKPILCHLSGKLHINHIRILAGDKVKVEMTPYDLTRGRIIWRYK